LQRVSDLSNGGCIRVPGQGLGMRILQALVEAATKRGASLLVLNARVTKMQIYQKFGFQTVDEVFGSPMTGVPHIKMQKEILQ
jgi:predicted GNAT family N-acyltransferase